MLETPTELPDGLTGKSDSRRNIFESSISVCYPTHNLIPRLLAHTVKYIGSSNARKLATQSTREESDVLTRLDRWLARAIEL